MKANFLELWEGPHVEERILISGHSAPGKLQMLDILRVVWVGHELVDRVVFISEDVVAPEYAFALLINLTTNSHYVERKRNMVWTLLKSSTSAVTKLDDRVRKSKNEIIDHASQTLREVLEWEDVTC